MIGIFRRKKTPKAPAQEQEGRNSAHEAADGAIKLAMSAVDMVIEEKRNARTRTARIIASVESFGLATAKKA